MSEYQFVHFLAVDRPVPEEHLEFMRRQSSRAEVTPWEFTNEYHFGDFHGNAVEMVRRGYDLHLHFANFGVRKLMFRLPAGLPCGRKAFEPFHVKGCVEWLPDEKGKAGILLIEPEADAGTFEFFSGVAGLLPEMAKVRQMLIEGDLRPLYLAWLACATEEDSLEPPVPGGLGKLPEPLGAMADFYEIGEDLIAAAAEKGPAAPKARGAGRQLDAWIESQPPEKLRKAVRRLLGDDGAVARVEILSEVRAHGGALAWPTAQPTRTFEQLRAAAEVQSTVRESQERKRQEAAQRKRAAELAADPDKAIAQIEQLIAKRSVTDYAEAAMRLAELRDALGPEKGPARVKAVAERLRRENPNSKHLVSALRKAGLLG